MALAFGIAIAIDFAGGLAMLFFLPFQARRMNGWMDICTAGFVAFCVLISLLR